MRVASSHAVALLLAAAAAALPARADEVFLVGGGRISGQVVERTPTRVAIETGPGRVTLPASRIVRIEEGRSALDVFVERAAGLPAGDAAGWAALGRWAEECGLLTQARQAWSRVLAADPQSPEANAGLGRVAVDGLWMSSDEAYQARGYVSHEGRWLTPVQHEAAVREQEAEERARREARESELRIREAEARVREAEARAEEAEAAASASTDGIPLGLAYGSGYGYGYGYGGLYPPLVQPVPPLRPIGPRHPRHRTAAPSGSPSGPPPAARPAQAVRPEPRQVRPLPRTAAILPPQSAPAPRH